MRWMLTPLLAVVVPFMGPTHGADQRAAFVTTLGRDTVVLESIVRNGSRLDGDIIVRVPSTVHVHYRVELAPDGSPKRATIDMTSMGDKDMPDRGATIEFRSDGIRFTVDSAGRRRTVTRPAKPGTAPLFMTGFGSSYGLYSSIGLYELVLERGRPGTNDTIAVPSIDLGTGATPTRRFVGRSPTQVDVDYFNIAWTHLTVDAAGRVSHADARETTEKTETQRTEWFDVTRTAKAFAAADRSRKGLGVASPEQVAKGTLGGQPVVVLYSSPRRRGRTILGNVVPYDRVWRTGANQSTTLLCDRALTIGTATIPAGTYSLWTRPTRDGAVELIVNRQHGQWGTNYDSAQDLVRVRMKTSAVSSPQEEFTIRVTGSGDRGELQMAWDTFLWTVPIALK